MKKLYISIYTFLLASSLLSAASNIEYNVANDPEMTPFGNEELTCKLRDAKIKKLTLTAHIKRINTYTNTTIYDNDTLLHSSNKVFKTELSYLKMLLNKNQGMLLRAAKQEEDFNKKLGTLYSLYKKTNQTIEKINSNIIFKRHLQEYMIAFNHISSVVSSMISIGHELILEATSINLD